MGLLTTLDYHNSRPNDNSRDHAKVEYRLHSWGEIFPPFMGDREHSVAARYILPNFPFKLFSTSKPYDDPLPQKLTLTFVAPNIVKHKSEKLHSAGIFPDEIAEEFAAFLSLITRRRVFTERQTRIENLPMEQDANYYKKESAQERQSLKEVNPDEIYQLLGALSEMDRNIANGFVLAIRLYHTAIQLMFTEPEFSYLLLITCLETISSVVYPKYRPEDEKKYLNDRFPGFLETTKTLGLEKQRQLSEILFKNQHFTFRKFAKFIEEFLPNIYWEETEDDAKPEYFYGLVEGGPDGRGVMTTKLSKNTLQPYEYIEKEKLPATLRNIYNARSKMVHSGTPFPKSIVVGHFRAISVENFAEIIDNTLEKGEFEPLAVPPLLSFEKLTSYTLTNYLLSMAKK
jgi:hypothetical protein